jgi:phospholipid transport system substrate-binding protein
MTLIKKTQFILSAVIYSLALLVLPVHAEEATNLSPKAAVKQTIDLIVEAVGEFKGNEHKIQRRGKIREIINPRFDFAKMAQLSLGAAWNTVTPAEQKEYVAVFSDLLSKTYMVKVETIEPGMVTVESERIEEGNLKASVKTLVKSKGDFFPIDYRLVNDNGQWKVYDVVIENIGLVVNYRNEFASIIRKDTFSGLMEQLKKKAAN